MLVQVLIKEWYMNILDRAEECWEHLYTQFKNPQGDEVLCMVHKETKKLVCFDVKLNRVLSKQEALAFRADVTGLHVIRQDKL